MAGTDILQPGGINDLPRRVEYLIRGLCVGHRLGAAKRAGFGVARRVDDDETDPSASDIDRATRSSALAAEDLRHSPFPPLIGVKVRRHPIR